MVGFFGSFIRQLFAFRCHIEPKNSVDKIRVWNSSLEIQVLILKRQAETECEWHFKV